MMTTKKKARQGQIVLQTTIGIASVLIGAGLTGQASPVKAASQQSSQALTALAAEKAVDSSNTQVLGQARDQENVSDDTATLNQSAASSSQVSAAEPGADSNAGASDQTDSQEPAVQENADFADQSIIYGDKSKIAPENLETKVFELYDVDTNEVLERHTFYVDKDETANDLTQFMSWYYGSGNGNLHFMGYQSPADPDDPDYFPDFNLGDLSNEGDQTIRLGVKRTDSKPRLSDGNNLYFERISNVSDENNLDPAMFIGNLGSLPANTKISWETAPQWGNDEYEGHHVLNLDQVAIRVEISGQEPVIIGANDRTSEYGDTLAELFDSLDFEFEGAGMQNTITLPLGELPDASTFFHPSDENGSDYRPYWGIKPNIGRAGYSFGWIGLDGPEGGLGSNKLIALVKVLPKQVSQSSVYHDVDQDQDVGQTSLPGQITDLYKAAGSLSADQLKAAIDGQLPAGYQIVAGYQYPASVQLSENMPQLLVPVRKVTTPEKPVDPPTPPDPKEPTDPTTPTDPEEPDQPTDPVTPVEPVEPVEPENPFVPTDPAKPADQPKAGPESVKVTTSTLVQPKAGQPAAKLPQTGNRQTLLSVLTLGLASIMTALGLVGKKKRD